MDEHPQAVSRAQHVRAQLLALWGEDLPATDDPELTVLIDAVCADDDRGADHGLIVQRDRLTLESLARALSRNDPRERLAALPAVLRRRLAALEAGSRASPEDTR